MQNGRAWFGGSGRKRAWLLILFAVGALAAAYGLFAPGLSLPDRPSPVPPAKKDVTSLGRLLPGGRILQIAAPPGAVIGELLVRRGQWVERGEVLARLRDHTRERASLHRAEKEVVVAASELERVRAGEKATTIEAQEAAVARQEAMVRQKETHYERMRALYERRVIAAREFEEAQTQRETAQESLRWERQHLGSLREIRKEDLALAASKVEAAEGARKVAGENVELNLIRAPLSGRVLDIYAFPGEAVPAKGLLELGSGRDMMVEVEVYVTDIDRVRLGAPAVVTGDAFRESLTGEVVEIVPMVTRSTIMPIDPLAFSDLRVVKAWIRLDRPQAVAALGNHQVSVTIKP